MPLKRGSDGDTGWKAHCYERREQEKTKCPIHITREKCEAHKSYPWKHQPVHTPRPCSDHGRRSSRVSIALRSKYCPRYSLKRALLNRCYLLRAAPLTRAALISASSSRAKQPGKSLHVQVSRGLVLAAAR